MVERVADIAGAAVSHLERIAAGNPGHPQLSAAAAGLSVSSLLAGITFFRIHDHTEQVGRWGATVAG